MAKTKQLMSFAVAMKYCFNTSLWCSDLSQMCHLEQSLKMAGRVDRDHSTPLKWLSVVWSATSELCHLANKMS